MHAYALFMKRNDDKNTKYLHQYHIEENRSKMPSVGHLVIFDGLYSNDQESTHSYKDYQEW
jgi:hypothetical protein